MGLQQLAQAAADAVHARGWKDSSAQTDVRAFQAAWNVEQRTVPVGPPDLLGVDGEWGSKTMGAAKTAGATRLPTPYYEPGQESATSPVATGTTGSLDGHPIDASGMTLHPAVAAAFFDFNAPIEGYTRFPYLDNRRLVTTGVGNLLDTVPGSDEPTEAFMRLPWRHGDGGPLASDAGKRAAWHALKASSAESFEDAKVTDLRLDVSEVAKLVAERLRANDAYLAAHMPGYSTAPAAAQLALNSWAWAVGPAAHFPALVADVAAGDWSKAADDIHINEAGNPGLHPRNIADRLLMLEAAASAKLGLDPLKLFYPGPVAGALGAAANAGAAVANAVRSTAGKVVAVSFVLALFGGLWWLLRRGA